MNDFPGSQTRQVRTNTAGIIALVLGVVALPVSFLPYFGVVGLTLAIPALILGIVGCMNKRGEKIVPAIFGLITGGVAFVFSSLWAVIFVAALASR